MLIAGVEVGCAGIIGMAAKHPLAAVISLGGAMVAARRSPDLVAPFQASNRVSQTIGWLTTIARSLCWLGAAILLVLALSLMLLVGHAGSANRSLLLTVLLVGLPIWQVVAVCSVALWWFRMMLEELHRGFPTSFVAQGWVPHSGGLLFAGTDASQSTRQPTPRPGWDLVAGVVLPLAAYFGAFVGLV
jgi:hypothetical protein